MKKDAETGNIIPYAGAGFQIYDQAIKKARTARGMTRDELSRIVDYDPRHLQAVENEGQKPSLELFIQLVTIPDFIPFW